MKIKVPSHLPIKSLLQQLGPENLSMRRRLFLYIFSALCMLFALLLMLFNLFGILNPMRKSLLDSMESQLLGSVASIEHSYDKTAAHAISFASQLEQQIQDYLTETNLTFDDLRDNTEAITALQTRLYNTVYLNMQLAPSSGAFYLLNTTVNSNVQTPRYNGIYLKYINLYSENTVNNDFSLYRGSVVTGKTNGITFHSGWQNEMKTDFFTTCNATFEKGVYYALSSAVQIPDTWERARYLYVPLHNLKGEIIGVCGYELNDLYFQLTHSIADSQPEHLIYALLDSHNEEYTGQFSSSIYSMSGPVQHSLKLTPQKELTLFTFDADTYVGQTRTIQLGSRDFTVAVMITQAYYENHVRKGQLNAAVVILIVALFSFAYCAFITKKYVTPILQKIELIKSSEEYGEQINIREIDDLFAYLEEKDTQYEEKLRKLERARQDAETETKKARAAYESAIEKYNLAHSQLQHLAAEQKKEIVLEEYEYFVANLKTLTPTEYRIYQLYLDGKGGPQIAALLDISENTLKYHNKNIYSKLGISSRKQLLRYAALKQLQDEKK